MDNKVPLNMAHETLDDDFDAPAESEVQYNEEMSRQAVGKLFASAGKTDTGKNPLVKGFGRDSAEERPPRQTARTGSAAVTPDEDSEVIQKEKAREIRVVERGRRRESATTRSTQPESREEAFQNGVRAATGRRPEVGGRQNPVTNAVTQGDTSPRQRIPRPVPAADSASATTVPVKVTPAEDSTGLDFDGFRQRYNPGELVSPPRNKNRPVRNPAARDVRKDRVKINDGDLETVNIFRLATVGGLVVVVALIGILFFQNMTLRGQRNEANLRIASLEAEAAANIGLMAEKLTLEAQRDEAIERRNEFHEILLAYGIDPYAPIPANGTPVQPPTSPQGPLPPPPPTLLPTTHTVASGESLAIIARRYFGQTFDLNDIGNMRIVQEHIARDNSPPINMNNINHIEIGWVLTINPFPTNPVDD